MLYFGDLVRRFVAQIYNLNATLISVPERRGPFLQSDFILLMRGNALDSARNSASGASDDSESSTSCSSKIESGRTIIAMSSGCSPNEPLLTSTVSIATLRTQGYPSRARVGEADGANGFSGTCGHETLIEALAPSGSRNISHTIWAGFPRTRQLAGTSLKTTELAETTAPSPIVTPATTKLPIAIQLP